MKQTSQVSRMRRLMRLTFAVLVVTTIISLSGCELLQLLNSYTVTYNGNGSTGGTVPVDIGTYKKDAIVTVLGRGSLVRANYTFEGWNTSASGTGTSYAPGSSFTMGQADVVLYARWSLSASPYTLGGGSQVAIHQGVGKYTYSLLAAQPTAKPQGDYDGSFPTYAFSLQTSTGTSSVIAPFSTPASRRASARDIVPVYPQGQLDVDKRNREEELQNLMDQKELLSRSSRDLVHAPPSPIVVGTTWNGVWVQNDGAWSQIDTTCRFVSNQGYFFVDNRDISTIDPLLTGSTGYGAAFDQIHTTNRTRFGTESDVDGNNKVIIVFTSGLETGVLGYFRSTDQVWPYTSSTHSNEGDIFYVSATPSYQTYIKGTLAHELQHMMNFDERARRGGDPYIRVWLNEALSQAAEYFNDHLTNHTNWMRSFLQSGWQGLALTNWTSSNYGYGAIFIRYLIDQYGTAAIRSMCSTNLNGVAAVEAATGEDFNTIFTNFSRALVMSGTGDSTDARYAFTTLDIRALQATGRRGLLPHSLSVNAGMTVSGTVYPYEIIFLGPWGGTFGTMTLSGTSIKGTGFVINY